MKKETELLEKELESIHGKNMNFLDENEILSKKLQQKSSEIEDLKPANKTATLAYNKLNQKIFEDREAITKDFKAQIKSWRKDLGEERREKIRAEKKLEDIMKKEAEAKTIVISESKTTQSEENSDIPYCITSPLPPIFSSNLCHISPRIRFLSNSLLDLDHILWVKPDNTY